VAVGAAIIIGILSLINVRDRRNEIGVLRALGTGRNAVFSLFVVRAVIAGVVGACIGVLIGIGVTGLFASSDVNSMQVLSGMYPVLFLTPVVTPLLAVAAVFLPARSASLQDPAITLSVE
jgi:ABC-type antimicrobial peptide transport system permease subunit